MTNKRLTEVDPNFLMGLADGIRLVRNEDKNLDTVYARLSDEFFDTFCDQIAELPATLDLKGRELEAFQLKVRDLLDEILFTPLLLRTADDGNLEAAMVQSCTEDMGQKLQLASDVIKDWGYIAARHDIGKAFVPGNILNGGKFTESWQFDEMKRHTLYGAAITNFAIKLTERLVGLQAIHRSVYMLRGATLLHHQKKDGLGYPPVYVQDEERPLQDDEIPEVIGAIEIADIYVALRTKRQSYDKPAMTHDEVMELMGGGDQKVDRRVFGNRYKPTSELVSARVWQQFISNHDDYRKIVDGAFVGSN